MVLNVVEVQPWQQRVAVDATNVKIAALNAAMASDTFLEAGMLDVFMQNIRTGAADTDTSVIGLFAAEQLCVN
ncbi:uncharacterized protein PHALS_04451 [Plasmopara halstedii]|uniref:Uncharacterized protein n=1 Tax=Plasmopara halstedii TaxID=4781 RepID=A0A0P1A8S8_PLAHL|nr:uncharacterized protein PHALS_04451 [Plasmopara halstedii]CEG36985.1 hypothetical protein PHALS_04451 [Plasmopara halstedii]|eukprot:XP_024573354.1 hypothetical protein PHALS_04451 [Plasmopara halstedii]